jgi:metal-responsive CopG/Arc/MetJ family transcriptional regulator
MADLYPARARIPKGLRRVLVLLPIQMVVDLDARIAQSRTSLSRSKVVALALKRFLDEGGVEDTSTDLDWSDLA